MHNNEIRHFFMSFLIAANRFLPILFWISVILSFDEVPIAMLTFLCAAFHEIGHIFVLLLYSPGNFKLKGVSSGLRLSDRHMHSYSEELLLYLSGPAANIILFLSSALFIHTTNQFALVFSALNAATAVSNLLPIEGYDGYGALRCILILRGHEEAAERILPYISFCTILILCLCALYFIDRLGEGYWIYFIFSASLIKKLDLLLRNNESKI